MACLDFFYLHHVWRKFWNCNILDTLKWLVLNTYFLQWIKQSMNEYAYGWMNSNVKTIMDKTRTKESKTEMNSCKKSQKHDFEAKTVKNTRKHENMPIPPKTWKTWKTCSVGHLIRSNSHGKSMDPEIIPRCLGCLLVVSGWFLVLVLVLVWSWFFDRIPDRQINTGNRVHIQCTWNRQRKKGIKKEEILYVINFMSSGPYKWFKISRFINFFVKLLPHLGGVCLDSYKERIYKYTISCR